MGALPRYKTILEVYNQRKMKNKSPCSTSYESFPVCRLVFTNKMWRKTYSASPSSKCIEMLTISWFDYTSKTWRKSKSYCSKCDCRLDLTSTIRWQKRKYRFSDFRDSSYRIAFGVAGAIVNKLRGVGRSLSTATIIVCIWLSKTIFGNLLSVFEEAFVLVCFARHDS